MSRILGSAAIAAVLVVAATEALSPLPVHAEHGDSVHADNVPVVWSSFTYDRDGNLVRAPLDADTAASAGISAVAGNLITGQAIKVCSEGTYERFARDAVAAWNTGVGHTILTYAGAPDSCPTTSLTRGHASIVVRQATQTADCGIPPRNPLRNACATPARLQGDPWYTFRGQGTVFITRLPSGEKGAANVGGERCAASAMRRAGQRDASRYRRRN